MTSSDVKGWLPAQVFRCRLDLELYSFEDLCLTRKAILMPNGGPRPDCVHCKNYRGEPLSQEEPFCEFHKIELPMQVYAFCANYSDPEPHGKDWLDEELDREKLQKDMMYFWLSGDDSRHFAVPLAPINEYGTWTRERFIDELSKLNDKYHPE